MRKHRPSHNFPQTPPRQASVSSHADHSVPPYLRKWAATPATTPSPLRFSPDHPNSSPHPPYQPPAGQSDSSYSSFALLAAAAAAAAAASEPSTPDPLVSPVPLSQSLPAHASIPSSTAATASALRERQNSTASPQSHPPRTLPTQSRARRHHSLHQDLPSSLTRLRSLRDRDRNQQQNPSHHHPPARFSMLHSDSPSLQRSDTLFTRARRVFSLPGGLKTWRRSHTSPAIPDHQHADSTFGTQPQTTLTHPLPDTLRQPPPVFDPSAAAAAAAAAAATAAAAGNSGGRVHRENSGLLEGSRRPSSPRAHDTMSGLGGRSARKTVRSVLSGRGAVSRHDSRHDTAGGSEGESETADSLQVRVRILENELEASRVRLARQRKRIQQLEDESSLSREALPALESIIKSALGHFEAKEGALKHTISKMHQEMGCVMAEKNEALRLLASFVGRSARSPPPSFSSMSEAGVDTGGLMRDGRRSGSGGSGPVGSGPGRRASLMDQVFGSGAMPAVGAEGQTGAGMSLQGVERRAGETEGSTEVAAGAEGCG